MQRIIYGLITLWLIISVTFFLLQFMPGSPFNDDKLTPEQVQILKEKYGLADPLPVQYVRYMSNVVTGDFGVSFKYDKQDVFQKLIMPRLPITVQVGSQAMIVGTLVGIFLGAVAALYRGKFWDNFVTVIAIIGVSVPSFVFAMLLQYYAGVKVQLLPIVYQEGVWYSTMAPAIAMALGIIASTSRFMRTELVEVLASDYILLAKAKGLTRPQIIYRHAIRNALVPVITILGPITIGVLTGSTVMEQIFGIPGVSYLMVQGIMQNDYFVILGVATFYSVLFIAVILIVDLLYGVIDPRIRLAGGGGGH
jgi:oligopeptide transport system permease protein